MTLQPLEETPRLINNLYLFGCLCEDYAIMCKKQEEYARKQEQQFLCWIS